MRAQKSEIGGQPFANPHRLISELRSLTSDF